MVTTTSTNRAVGYLRRSTDQQDRSLGDQRAAIEMYAATHGIDIVEFYIDDAISGTRSHGRNAFQQMIEDARTGAKEFDRVIVYDVKRFGRMDNDETGYYRHLLRTFGVRVCYTAQGFTARSLAD